MQKMTSRFIYIMKDNRNDSSETRSQKNFNTVEYLLDKQPTVNHRKISDYNFEETRTNFVLRHNAQTYSVNRLYLDSLDKKRTVRLYYSKFTPAHKSKDTATLCIVHGYGQSSDNFIEMAEYFAKSGFIVNMIDLRGFGYSGGTRVFQSFKGLLSDIQNLLRRCCQNGRPTYLLGHGFGSLLVLALLEENLDLPLSGVICLSPLFKFPCFRQVSLLGRFFLYLLSLIWPYLEINNQINPTALTNNMHKMKKCIDGVFNHQFVSYNMGKAHQQLSEKVLRDAEKFKYPLLLMHGGKDLVQPIDDVKRFYRYAGSEEKSSFLIKNGFHQLYNDEEAEKDVFPKIIEWIYDSKSNKNQTKWAVTGKFNLDIIKTVPPTIKYTLLALLPVAIFILIKLRSLVRARLKLN